MKSGPHSRTRGQAGCGGISGAQSRDAGVNIELVAPVGMSDQKVTVAFGLDKVEEARKALGSILTREAMGAGTGTR